MQNYGVTNKEHYGVLQYFLEWSIAHILQIWQEPVGHEDLISRWIE